MAIVSNCCFMGATGLCPLTGSGLGVGWPPALALLPTHWHGSGSIPHLVLSFLITKWWWRGEKRKVLFCSVLVFWEGQYEIMGVSLLL